VHNARFAAAFAEWAEAEPGPVPFECVNDGAEEEPDKLGGIGDLDLGLRRLEELNPGRPTLVLAGDNLIEFSLAPYFEEFREHGLPLLLARLLEGEVPPGKYGEITADESGRVLQFREKPADPRSQLAATCLYFFPPGIHTEVQSYLEGGGDPDAPGHFIGWLSQRREVRAAPFTGKLWDIGDRQSLDACREALGSRGD